MEVGTSQETTGESGQHVRPLPDGSDIRKLTEADIPRVSLALARGFQEDPVAKWCYPDDSKRTRKQKRQFELLIRRSYLPHGACYTTTHLAGGALWVPPHKGDPGLLEQLRMLPRVIGYAGRDSLRVLRLVSEMERRHPHESHYYLPFVAVEPEWQGRGFGAALMQPILDRCDAEGLPAYLEASTPRNRALYERLGFEVSGDDITVADSPPFKPMWREPRPVSV